MLVRQLKEILINYKTILLDIWGVLTDGVRSYPGGFEILKELSHAPAPVILLSNTTYLPEKVYSLLIDQGYNIDCFSKIVTSGMMFQNYLLKHYHPDNDHCYYMGESQQRELVSSLGFKTTVNLKDARFLVLTSFEEYFDANTLFSESLSYKLPMLCVNPDVSIKTLSGKIIYCAGYLARLYLKMGGEVVFLGKPNPAFYHFALSGIHFEKNKVLCIGDGIDTDILGAHRMGFHSLLINKKWGAKERYFEPTYIGHVVNNKITIGDSL